MKTKILFFLLLCAGTIPAVTMADPAATPQNEVGRYVPTLIKFDDGRVILLVTDTTTGATKIALGNNPKTISFCDYLAVPFPEIKGNVDVRDFLNGDADKAGK